MSNYFENRDLFLEPKVNQYGSHMVMTNVHKQNKTKYINIDTTFRDEYNNNELVNYNVTLPERINDIKKMTVKSVELPMTMYNISAALGNNYFKLSNDDPDTPVSGMITLSDGVYTMASLQSEITYQISNLTNVLGIDAASSLNYLIFDIQNNKSRFYRNFLPTPENGLENDIDLIIDFAIDKYGNFDKYNFKSKLGWLLGYRNTTYTIKNEYETNNLNPYVYEISEAFTDLNGSKYLYLAIDEFSKNNPNSFVTPLPTSLINKSIIARIALDKTNYGFNSILPANMYNGLLISDVRTYTGKIDLQKLNLQLLNDFGNPVSLNGMDFSLCLEVEYE
jgi:hypothetical protein